MIWLRLFIFMWEALAGYSTPQGAACLQCVPELLMLSFCSYQCWEPWFAYVYSTKWQEHVWGHFRNGWKCHPNPKPKSVEHFFFLWNLSQQLRQKLKNQIKFSVIVCSTDVRTWCFCAEAHTRKYWKPLTSAIRLFSSYTGGNFCTCSGNATAHSGMVAQSLSWGGRRRRPWASGGVRVAWQNQGYSGVRSAMRASTVGNAPGLLCLNQNSLFLAAGCSENLRCCQVCFFVFL